LPGTCSLYILLYHVAFDRLFLEQTVLIQTAYLTEALYLSVESDSSIKSDHFPLLDIMGVRAIVLVLGLLSARETFAAYLRES
jgi:hypothetical protein